jgi:lipid A disaccharide synthetase
MICPEFVQGNATPRNLVDAIDPLLTATPQRREMMAALGEVNARLGAGGAAERAADIVCRVL